MKTKNILSTIILFVLSISIFASEPESMTNEMETEFGKQVTITSFVGDSGALDRRTENKYNHDGVLFERTISQWVSYDGWRPLKKLSYTYNEDGVLIKIATLSWIPLKKCWDTNPIVKEFDADGKVKS